MKPGRRALGIAESFEGSASTLAGSVVRADRIVDGLAFETCTVGGTDATAACLSLVRDLDRQDIRYLMVAGIAPAWYNILDLHRLHEETGLPVLSVSFEKSDGLASAIDDAFDDGTATMRRERYRSQPRRRSVEIGTRTLFLRHVGFDAGGRTDDGDGKQRTQGAPRGVSSEPVRVLRAFTPEKGRPEPLRVARLAARAGDAFRRARDEPSG